MEISSSKGMFYSTPPFSSPLLLSSLPSFFSISSPPRLSSIPLFSSPLPPSSPIQQKEPISVEDADTWRQQPIFPSDDPLHESVHKEGESSSSRVPHDSDLPIADYDDDEAMDYPPETPMTELQSTPHVLSSRTATRVAGPSAWSASQDARSHWEDTRYEDAMDIDTTARYSQALTPTVSTGVQSIHPSGTPRQADHHQISAVVSQDIATEVSYTEPHLSHTPKARELPAASPDQVIVQNVTTSPHSFHSNAVDNEEPLPQETTLEEFTLADQYLASEAHMTAEEIEEHDDAETVDRELSQEPDFHDDDNDDDDEEVDPAVAGLPPPTRSMSEMVPQSSPHNPFRVYTPGHAVTITEGTQTYVPSPLGVISEGVEASVNKPESSSTPRRGPPRPWPPTPAETSIEIALPLPQVVSEGEEFVDYTDEDPSIVQITSADPRAAARAAAILKLVSSGNNDYV